MEGDGGLTAIAHQGQFSWCVEVAPRDAVECAHAAAAIRRSEVLTSKETNAGAIAFSRSGSPELGEFEGAVILRTFGDVPDDLRFVA
jgi:hypothetical protein